MARSINILCLKHCRAHPDKLRGAPQIFFCKVNVALLIAAIGAASLAGEANGVHQPSMIVFSRGRAQLYHRIKKSVRIKLRLPAAALEDEK